MTLLLLLSWEQRKLGDIAEIVGGGTPNTNIAEYWDGNIDWYSPAEIKEQIYVKSSRRKISEKGYNNSSARMLPVGTVLFTSRAGIGKTAILAKEGCTNQGFQSIVPNPSRLDSYFIFSRTRELKQYGESVGAGSTFAEVSGKQMANMKLKIPATVKEQQKIGELFRKIDGRITFQQRKLEHLQLQKKALLQKMFPKDGTNVPDLRFPGFTDAWEQRKLGDCFLESEERSTCGELLSVTIEKGIRLFRELDRKDNSSEDKSNYKKVEKGDLVYNSMRMWQGACGCSIYSGIVSPAYTVLKVKKGNRPKFFEYLFKRQENLFLFQRYSQGLTSDTWNLKYPLFSRIKIYTTNCAEQQRISDFFQQLDALITFQQRKHKSSEVLKQKHETMEYKSSIYHDIDVYAYSWEQRKLGEILDYEQPSKYIVKENNYGTNGIPVLTAGKTFILGYIKDKENIKNATKTHPIIIFDDFTTSSRLVDFPFKIKSSAIKLLDGIDNSYDIYFLYYVLKNIKYNPQNHERHWISKFSKFMVLVPVLDEQQKIAAIFKKIDTLITFQQRNFNSVE